MEKMKFLKNIITQVEKRLTSLILSGTTGKVTVEINLTQGGIGDSSLSVNTKESLKQVK